MAGRTVSSPQFAQGDPVVVILPWQRKTRADAVIVKRLGRTPYPDMLELHYLAENYNAYTGIGNVYRQSPLLDKYLAALTAFDAVAKAGSSDPAYQRTAAAVIATRDAAWCVHPAGAAYFARHGQHPRGK
jgi:hypothetical protein